MPKGDPSRIQNAIDYQGGMAQNNLNNQRARWLNQNNTFWNNYQNAVGQQTGDYNNMMNQYKDIYNRPDVTMSPEYKARVDSALGGYQNFANTGGFSPQDIQDIRARDIAPTRSIYQRGTDELRRQAALTGNAANIPSAISRMARQGSAAISDANINANAGIAQQVQQGKLAGLGGLSSVGMGQEGLQNQIDQFNNNRLLAAAEGMRSLYGTNPALASMFGNQVLTSTGQGNQIEDMQQQLANMIIQGQLGRGRMPSNWDAFSKLAGGLRDIGSMAGGIAGAF